MDPKVPSVKLLARIHDPAEKLLILFDRAHERGTVAALRRNLFGDRVPSEIERIARTADHWAAAADRPQWPKDRRVDAIRFTKKPELVHPLSGERCGFDSELRCDLDQVEASSLAHASRLIRKSNGEVDFGATALAFWRWLPEAALLDEEARTQLGQLWTLLPADSRVPDHTIWAHLDLTAALASAMAADPDGRVGLLLVSIGPVQEFIATARSISDLWAGSHLLSTLTFEGMKVVLERLGPEQIVFPFLRGLPVVDYWLETERGLPQPDGMDGKGPSWRQDRTDSNPLFVAAFPNRFLALVPHGQGRELAEKSACRMRAWLKGAARRMLGRLSEKLGTPFTEDAPLHEQIRRQFEGFPEVYWSLVPLGSSGEGVDAAAERLQRLLARFHPADGSAPGFFGSRAWQLLRSGHRDPDAFFPPNTGILYPAAYDLVERAHAAAKTLRPFVQHEEAGYRCSLCGEREWLTLDPGQLGLPPGQRRDTLWTRIAEKRSSWARKGEHLCAPCALKRLWPDLWAEELRSNVPKLEELQRYVVSTHTMAAARDLEHLAELSEGEAQELLKGLESGDVPPLPPRLAFLRARPAARVLAALETLRERAEGDDEDARNASERLARLEGELRREKSLGRRPETYYAVLLMDGDRMGAWLAGNTDETTMTYRESWHSDIVDRVGELGRDWPELRSYVDEKRPPSPARHMAISEALNAFAVHLVPTVTERLFKGRLIYAGGDDVLAFVSIDDLLPVLLSLRILYSGLSDEHWPPFEAFGEVRKRYRSNRGFVFDRKENRIRRVMGTRATASTGAVVAHALTPLRHVLAELRKTEREAKERGGRDAFAIRVLKRSGGADTFVAKWFADDPEHDPIRLLMETAALASTPGFSRRAVYQIVSWLAGIPDDAGGDLLALNLARQLVRQSEAERIDPTYLTGLARRLTCAALQASGTGGSAEGERGSGSRWLRDLFIVAEFLGRDGRAAALRPAEAGAGRQPEEATHG